MEDGTYCQVLVYKLSGDAGSNAVPFQPTSLYGCRYKQLQGFSWVAEEVYLGSSKHVAPNGENNFAAIFLGVATPNTSHF